jgi:CRP/FNR family cyclic AMP-dependent transcriptional regulator
VTLDQDRDERIARGVKNSFLAGLPSDIPDQLLADALLVDVPAGAIVYREHDPPRCMLVVSGLIRVYFSSRVGRQVTVCYSRPGAMLGAPTAIGGPAAVGAQAVTDSALLMFSPAALRTLASGDVRVAWPLAQEVTRLLYDVLDAFAGNAFGSVRQRVARHLLDLATTRQTNAVLRAEVNQQALADAVGSAREVVARTLHDFRSAGLVRSTREGIVLLDADRIEVVATSGEL